MAQLEVNLVSARETVWAGAARMVVAPAADGEIGLLAGHTPVLSVLRSGTVRVQPIEGDPIAVAVSGGFLSIDSDVVTIVVDDADVVVAATSSH